MALLDLFRGARVEPRRVHTISSVSAMLQMAQGGFGVATLPREAVQHLFAVADLRELPCDARPQPLPIHASYRSDPSTQAVETVVRSALAFVEAWTASREGTALGRSRAKTPQVKASKKSMT